MQVDRVVAGSLRVLAGALLVLAIFRMGVAVRGNVPDHPGHASRFSLLALGDTGKVHRPFAWLFEGQLSVGRDLVAEDRAHPVDAVLFLGDNFYMRGLRSNELVERIRMNLALPYCGLVSLSGPRSSEVAGSCVGERALNIPRPLYAVLGNHDHLSRESPTLQRDAVPAYIDNWQLSTEVVTHRRLAPGIDLILLDSSEIERGGFTALHREALAGALGASAGPWRLIASHAGGAVEDHGGLPDASTVRGRFGAFVARAIADANAPVQLFLAGHHHTLQAVEGEGGLGPALHVIAGSGSRSRPLGRSHPRVLYSRVGLGFARIDFVARDRGEHVEVSLFESAPWPVLRTGPATRGAVFRVDLDGRIRALD